MEFKMHKKHFITRLQRLDLHKMCAYGCNEIHSDVELLNHWFPQDVRHFTPLKEQRCNRSKYLFKGKSTEKFKFSRTHNYTLTCKKSKLTIQDT